MAEDQNETYPIPTETIRGLPWEHHLNDLLEVRAFCENFEIRTKNTRLARYEEFLRRFINHGQVNPESVFRNQSDAPFQNWIECLQYVLREVHELMWILKGLQASLPKGVKGKLEQIVSGRDFAFLDVDSRSRDTQFELRIASYFCQAGCEVDLTTETDVIAYADDFVYFLECKRVGSPSQLRRRLSGAKEQLRKRMPKKVSGKLVFGGVAADVTKIAFPHNGLTFGMVSDHSKDVIQKKLLEVCKTAENYDLFNGSKLPIVYWFQIHIAALVLYPQTLTSRFSSNHIYRTPRNRKEQRAVDDFWGRFTQVSAHDCRSDSPQQVRLRESIAIPAGTKCFMNEKFLEEMLGGIEIAGKDDNFIVGGMEIDGIEIEFSFREFSEVFQSIGDDAKSDMAKEPTSPQTQVRLLAMMWSLRHPFEVVNSEE